MKRYLEYYENEWPENISELTAIENKPFVGYLNGGEVKYTVIPKPVSINYFYIESLEDNNVIILDSTTWAGYGDNKSKLEYSNDAASWTSMNGVDSITINNGERLYMRCIDGNICKDMFSIPEEEAEIVVMTPLFKTSTNCNIGGNINTAMFDYTYKTEDCVLPGGAFAGLFMGIDLMTEAQTNYNYIIDASKLVLPSMGVTYGCYNSMFFGCTLLTTAPELLATTLAAGCYADMFYGCTSLAIAPELPATTLADDCYREMFVSCTSLTTAPELHAMTLAENCYASMFHGCESLTTAPELPATTLANHCYNSMFSNCTSLTTAPALPATELAANCYYSMFDRCTSLTAAPELPAATLAEQCYASMFRGCTSLNYIKCLATDILSDMCTYGWVYNVSPTGTFIKHPDMNDWSSDGYYNGIPEGWTVIDAEV